MLTLEVIQAKKDGGIWSAGIMASRKANILGAIEGGIQKRGVGKFGLKDLACKRQSS